MNRDHSVVFETASKYCSSDSFVDYEGYSISSKGFLPTEVDIMVIWVKLPISVHFSSLITNKSMFTLAISCLTTSNLPRIMDLTFLVPKQYCSYSFRLYFHHQSHPQLGIVLLWLRLFILSGVLSPLISSSILGTYRPGQFIFQCPIFLPFHTSWGSEGKNTEVVCHSPLQWTTFCQNSPPWPMHLGWPYTAWLIVSLS